MSPSSTDSVPFDRSLNDHEEHIHWRGRLIYQAWPIDEIELERQEADHWLLRLLLGYPFIGPVREILTTPGEKRILDVATGTGMWAIDVAEMFPWVEILGVDSMAVQPE